MIPPIGEYWSHLHFHQTQAVSHL